MAKEARIVQMQGRITELESLVAGLAREIGVLNVELERRNDFIFAARLRLARLEQRLRAAGIPTNGELDD